MRAKGCEDLAHLRNLRKLEKIAGADSANNTFRVIVEEWLAEQELEGRATVTLRKNRWPLEFSYPILGCVQAR